MAVTAAVAAMNIPREVFTRNLLSSAQFARATGRAEAADLVEQYARVVFQVTDPAPGTGH